MFKIHKKIKYALTALKYMKSRPANSKVSAKEICEEFDIPFDPTSRVLQIMAQNGILEAIQGAHGGYRLVGDLSKIALFDLSGMIVGPLAVTDCSSDDSQCDRLDRCVLKKAMGRLNSRVLKVFKDVKISTMV